MDGPRVVVADHCSDATSALRGPRGRVRCARSAGAGEASRFVSERPGGASRAAVATRMGRARTSYSEIRRHLQAMQTQCRPHWFQRGASCEPAARAGHARDERLARWFRSIGARLAFSSWARVRRGDARAVPSPQLYHGRPLLHIRPCGGSRVASSTDFGGSVIATRAERLGPACPLGGGRYESGTEVGARLLRASPPANPSSWASPGSSSSSPTPGSSVGSS